jgi:lipoprotein-releasing system permease protein
MRSKSSKSGLIINIAIAAVAISIAVMLISVAVVKGYQLQITNKITGFSNDIQITRLDFNNSFETNPIYRDSALEHFVIKDTRIKFIQPFAIKAGIIKTADEFEGIVLKGIITGFHWEFIKNHIEEGEVFDMNDSATSNSIVISSTTARKLKLKTGENLIIYFVQDEGSLPRARKFIITGIYNTGFSDLDAMYGIIDLRHIQRLNKWNNQQVSGYEVSLQQYKDLDAVSTELLSAVPYHLQVKPITEIYPQLFDWLGLLDLNVVVIIILMVVVACINMSTALLILIVERSNMIGMLKAMGSRNKLVQRIFLIMAGRLIIRGMLIGNLAGLSICITQYYLGWIRLDQDAYFLDRVPIFFTWMDVSVINAGAFALCLIVMLLPVKFVTRINPVKSIRFE